MKRTQAAAAAIAVVVLFSAIYFFYPKATEPSTLKIFCAGSLLYPLQRVGEAYTKANPSVKVEVEGHGSIQVIREITELHSTADILMVADYSLIPVMMYNLTVAETGRKYATWCIRFSGNSLVLAYTEKSKYTNEVNANNWYEILGRQGVKYGTPNPMIDALGYRSLMTLQLAEYYYGDSGIFEKIFGSNFDPVFQSVALPNRTVIFVPEVQKPANDKVILRASSIQLAPLLELGTIDYAFLYLSNARQYGFKYVDLPSEIDLSSEAEADGYERVEVRFLQQRFGSITLNREGKTVQYGLTIPSTAMNVVEAERFTEYLLNGEGRTVFGSLWHPIYVPCYADNVAAVPERVRSVVRQEP